MKGGTINNPRRAQSAKPRLYRAESEDKAVGKEAVVTKLRPSSAYATSSIEPDVYGYESGKMLSGTGDNFLLESMKPALTTEIASRDTFQAYPVERNKEKYEMYECTKVTVQEV